MMEFEGGRTSIISADLTRSAFIYEGLFSNAFSSFNDCQLEIVGTLGIGTAVF